MQAQVDAGRGSRGGQYVAVVDEEHVRVDLHHREEALEVRGVVPVRRRRAAAERGIRAGFLLVEPDHAGMNEIARLVEDGRLRAEVETVLPLSQAAKAHELSETGRTTGKIVLSVAD